VGTFEGIPDAYDGRVLTKTWTYTSSLPALTDGKDTYLVCLPVPGVAYFYGQVTAGSLTLIPVYYPDHLSVFVGGQETTNASAFRYGGLAMEIIPTVNAMTWTSSVQVFRGPVELSIKAVSASATAYSLGGLMPLVNSVKPDAVHPFNMGCFCISRQTDTDFPFHPVLENTITNEINVAQTTGATAVTFGATAGQQFTGLGSMESIIYKIPAYTAAGNALTLRTWAFMEMQVTSTSTLYEYTHISPPSDAVALALVKKPI